MSFEVTVEKLVYGGEGLGYSGGKVILVSGSLPGERLEVEELRTAKGVVHARSLRLIEPSSERMEAPCPFFGRCGGCQYQHFRPEQQSITKGEILRETLLRIGKIAWEQEIPLHTARPLGYRNQAQFKVSAAQEASVEIGFYQAESHRLVPINACLIVSAKLNAILAELRRSEWLEKLRGAQEIDLMADHNDDCAMMVIRAQKEGPLSDSNVREVLATDLLRQMPGLQTAAFDRNGRYEFFGQPALSYQVREFRYQVSPGSFFQASRFLLPELVNAALNTNSGATASEPRTPDPEPRGLALDLFAGVGLFTLPLGRRYTQVIGVEGNPGYAADLKANALRYDFTNIRSVSLPVFDFLRRFAQGAPDLVLLDPPRAGMGSPALKRLTDLAPRRIHYVSCHPPTLARDLHEFLGRGYRLESIEMFDLFPQTYHIESVARLVRGASEA